jgi:tRNA threonylcarbamoyladenosine biosynthesis protein TsaB
VEPAVNLLAIETATPACAIGVRTREGVERTAVLDEHRRHTEALTPGIAVVLEECGLTPRDIDRVVVDVGPGLYTGLRVGIATATAFAQALGCDVVAVNSLELLAHGAQEAGVTGLLVSCVDARRGEVFVQTFRLDDDVTSSGPPEVTQARAVVVEWATNGSPVTFTGDGVARYLGDFAAVPNGSVHTQFVPPVHVSLTIGSTRTPEGPIRPLYLREPDAVANFSTRARQ